MKKSVRIIVIIVVLVLIALVFFVKRGERTESVIEIEESVVEEEVETEMIPLEFTSFSFEDFFAPGLPLLLDLGSEGCGPCRAMKPDLEAFYLESYGKVTVRYADIWEDPALSGGLPAMAVPVQYFFHSDGTPYVPSEELSSSIGFYMYSLSETGEHVLTCHYGMLSKDQMYQIFREMGVDL